MTDIASLVRVQLGDIGVAGGGLDECCIICGRSALCGYKVIGTFCHSGRHFVVCPRCITAFAGADANAMDRHIRELEARAAIVRSLKHRLLLPSHEDWMAAVHEADEDSPF
jgi:hypothetical protein